MKTQKIGDKIRELRKKIGLSQKEFAKIIGISYGALQSYEYGEIEPRSVILRAIAARFDVPLSFFISEEKPIKTQNIAAKLDLLVKNNEKNFYLNFYDDVRASAGYGSCNYDSPPKKIPVSTQFLENILRVPAKNYDVIRAIGDSMEPFIKDNDMVLVDRDGKENVKNGDIIIAIFEDSLYVKKYLIDPISRVIKLTSLNNFYQDITIRPQEKDQLFILGKVKAKFNNVGIWK